MNFLYFLQKRCSYLALFLAFWGSFTITQAQWKRISGPDGGIIRELYHYNSTFFVRTPSGIFRSTDNATSWQDVNLSAGIDIETTPVFSFASSGTKLFASMAYGLYFSSDSGKTWLKCGSSLQPDFLVVQDSILISANYNYDTYPQSSIGRSTSNGASWNKIKLDILSNAQITGLARTPTSVLVTTAAHGMLLSTDTGKTWNILKNNLSTEPISSLTADGSIYYCGTTYGKIFKSIDNGTSWQEIAVTSTKFQVSSILAQGSTLYYSTLGGGLFCSTDNGVSWKECTTGPMRKRIFSVVGVAPNLIAYTDQVEGIFRSTDSGDTWEIANRGVNSQILLRVFTDSDTLYTQTSRSGCYRTSDQGASWEKPFPKLPTDVIVSCFCRYGNTIFVGSDNKGVFRSQDNGEHWEAINTGISELNINSIVLDKSTLCITANRRSIYVSTNNGDTWFNASPGTDYPIESIFIHDNVILVHPFISFNGGQSWQFDSLPWYNNTKCIVEYDSILYAGTSFGLYKSLDHGISWKLIGLQDYSISSIYLSSTTMYVVIGGQEVRLSIDNGINWNTLKLQSLYYSIGSIAALGTTLYAEVPSGIYSIVDTTLKSGKWLPSTVQNEYVRSITSIDTTIFAGIEEKGVMKCVSFTRKWLPVNTGLDNLFVRKLVSKGSLLIAGTAGGVYLSRDKGEHWATTSSILSTKNVISLEWKDTFLFAGTNTGGMYRSSDSGATWTQVYVGSPTNSIFTIAATGTSLFAGTNSGILRSIDNGEHWEAITVGKNTSAVYGIYATSTMILAGTDFYGIFKSTDNGNTWKESNTGLITKLIWTLASNGQAIFAGTVGGVFSSTDEGTTWNSFGLVGQYISALHTTSSAIYAGLSGSGSLNNTSIWSTLLQTTSVSEPSVKVSHGIAGLLCYPNPATTTLTIDYSSLPFHTSTPATCTITSLTGEVMRQFELQEALTTLPMEDFASGVYMITLRQGLQRSSTLFSILH